MKYLSVCLRPILLIFTIVTLFTACTPQAEKRIEPFSPLNMITIPFQNFKIDTGITFPTGVDDSSTQTINYRFSIGETELSYGLWKIVSAWALDETIDHDGNGIIGDDIYTFSGRGRRESDSCSQSLTGLEPVTMLNWRDAIVFCNALTEYSNATRKTKFTCVYYSDALYISPIRISSFASKTTPDQPGSLDAPYIKAEITGNLSVSKCIADGLRIPTNAEWELAARWCSPNIENRRGLISRGVNGGSEKITPGYFWIPGSCASGTWIETEEGWIPSGESGSDKITGKAISGPNDLGIYGLNGHVWEWCYDWHEKGVSRVLRDASSDFYWAKYQTAGEYTGFRPYAQNFNLGFRLARTEF